MKLTSNVTCVSTTVLLLGVTLSSSVLAGDAPSDSAPKQLSPASSSGDRAAQVLREYALKEHDSRVTGAWISVGTGTGVTIWGIVDNDRSLSTPLWISGLV